MWRSLLFLILLCACPLVQAAPPLDPQALSLLQAIELSLKNNPEVGSIRVEPGLATQEELVAKAILDTTLEIQGIASRDVSPSSSELTGPQVTETNSRGEVSLTKKLGIGTELELGFSSAKRKDSALYTNLSPEYPSDLSLGLTQPLLKGAWSGRPTVIIEAKTKLKEAAEFQFAAKLSNEISKLIGAYWKLKLAFNELKVKEKSLSLAEGFRRDAQAAVDVGLQAEIAVSQALSQVSIRTEELLEAQNKLEESSNALGELIADQNTLSLLSSYSLSDEPEFSPDTFELEQSIEVALSKRPEIKSQELLLKSLLLEEQTAENEVLPEVNLLSSIGLQGLAGDPLPSSSESADPDRFKGDYSDSLDSLRSKDFYRYEVGVQLKYPLDNSRARAQLNSTRLRSTRGDLKLEQLKKAVIVEVRNAKSGLTTSTKRIEAAKLGLDSAEKGLAAGVERFKSGVGTSREVLELQKDLAQSELNTAKALIDYQLALSAIRLARGELLDHYNIKID